MAKLTLYEIETGLVEVYAAHEAVTTDESSTPEEIAAVETTLREYLDREVAKVDGIAFFMREMEARAGIYKEEAERMTAAAKRHTAAYDRIRGYVLDVMLRTGRKKLEGERNTFAVKKNPASLEITDQSLVQNVFKEFSINLTHPMLHALCGMLAQHAGDEGKLMAAHIRKVARATIINEVVKSYLKSNVECPTCSGSLIDLETGDPCAVCIDVKGVPTGKVPATTPGARLITDRVRVDLDSPRAKKSEKIQGEITAHANPQILP